MEQELNTLKKEVLNYADLMMRSDLISDRQLYGIKKSIEVKGSIELQIAACSSVLEALNEIYTNMAVAYNKKKKGQKIICLGG
jgi:hypothetical protein